MRQLLAEQVSPTELLDQPSPGLVVVGPFYFDDEDSEPVGSMTTCHYAEVKLPPVCDLILADNHSLNTACDVGQAVREPQP